MLKIIGLGSNDTNKIKMEHSDFCYIIDDHFARTDSILTKLRFNRSKKKIILFAQHKSCYDKANHVDIANHDGNLSIIAKHFNETRVETLSGAKSVRPGQLFVSYDLQPSSSQLHNCVHDHDHLFRACNPPQRDIHSSSDTPTADALCLDMFETNDGENEIQHSINDCADDHEDAHAEPCDNASYDNGADDPCDSQDDWDQKYEQDTLCLLEPKPC